MRHATFGGESEVEGIGTKMHNSRDWGCERSSSLVTFPTAQGVLCISLVAGVTGRQGLLTFHDNPHLLCLLLLLQAVGWPTEPYLPHCFHSQSCRQSPHL